MRIRVVTLNLLHGAPIPGSWHARVSLETRLAWTSHRLAEEHPDVVLLQEASASATQENTAAALARSLGMHFVYARANPSPLFRTETVFGVIYPPQVALVGFGRVVERPWAAGGMIGVRPVISASLSGDHRASDGHRGGRFSGGHRTALAGTGEAMTANEIRDVALRVLRGIAPESDPAQLDPQAIIRDELDLDSVDFMNFVVGLHEALGVDVPEADYAKIATMDGCVAYLAAKLGGG